MAWLCVYISGRTKKDSVISVFLTVCLKIIANHDITASPLLVNFFVMP